MRKKEALLKREVETPMTKTPSVNVRSPLKTDRDSWATKSKLIHPNI